MCALALALLDFGCSLSFEVGPVPVGDDGGPGAPPQNDAGIPDTGSTSADADTSPPPKQQPPQFIGKSTQSPSNANAFTVSKPPNALLGDLLLASIYVTDQDNVITFPAGWTVIDKRVLPTCEAMTVWAYHFYSDADPSTYEFGIQFARANQKIAIAAYRGVDPSRPIGQHNVTEYSGTLFYGPVSLITDQPNETLVMMSVNEYATGSWSTPSGMTLRADTDVLGIFDEPRPSAGKTDPRTATSTGTASQSCGDVELVGLRPAPL